MALNAGPTDVRRIDEVVTKAGVALSRERNVGRHAATVCDELRC